MLIIPAVDIQDGCVVRLVQGRLDKKIYSRDPVKTAKHWARLGARLLHVVDLDGAFTGTPRNLGLVKAIAQGSGALVQFGGGVRTVETIKTALEYGVSRVILGTKAVEDESFLRKVFKMFKDRVVISADAKDGLVLIKGWQSGRGAVDIIKFAALIKKIGFTQLIYTDVLKDGTLKGPNIKGIKTLLKETGLHIIASGGISSLADINRLKVLEKAGLTGVIVGKALYEGKFTLTQALKLG
jgi:phosphoribosylformimino-5-aminoimidazole carboxamide ribotide isomerase